MIRFETLANHPAAGALNFERCLKIAVEYVIGWDSDAGVPLKNRGVWGTPSGHLRIVEEQFRLTLHSHHLIWLHGHQNIEHQLKVAQHLSAAEVLRANVSSFTGDSLKYLNCFVNVSPLQSLTLTNHL